MWMQMWMEKCMWMKDEEADVVHGPYPRLL
jgi:hypothetical protein